MHSILCRVEAGVGYENDGKVEANFGRNCLQRAKTRGGATSTAEHGKWQNRGNQKGRSKTRVAQELEGTERRESGHPGIET
eukprot:6179649-Pleurochrysis_carterae.AAC.1